MTPDWWPTGQQEQLLQAALWDGESARRAWDAWQAGASVERLDEASFHLLPLLYDNASRLGLTSPSLPRLRGAHRQSWSRNQLLFRQVAPALTALHASDIDTLVLKAVPLALLHYGDIAARPTVDADVLVKPGDVERSVAVLARCGWRPKPDPPVWPPEPRASWPFTSGERALNLHWRVFEISRVPDDDVWTLSVPASVSNVPTRALAPADQLLDVIVHGLQSPFTASMLWIADAAMVIRRGSVDWDRVLDEAARRRFLPAVHESVKYLHRRLNVPVPHRALERLQTTPRARLDRLEFWARRRPGISGAVTRVWFDYRRLAMDDRGTAPRMRIGEFLRRRWRMPAGEHVTAQAARRVAARWR